MRTTSSSPSTLGMFQSMSATSGRAPLVEDVERLLTVAGLQTVVALLAHDATEDHAHGARIVDNEGLHRPSLLSWAVGGYGR